ncbi:MAG: RimJ/RimL family protein N-acetyltransferase [Glaciecola sp.]|jgi:RimJ/RimL family protein N-acetyltransferase
MQYRLSGYGVELRSVVESDIEMLRQWRNKDDIRSMMKSTSYITKEQQKAWFDGLEDATHVRHFLISYKEQGVGSATLTGTSFVSGFTDDLENAKEIETGLYIGHESYRNNILAFAPSLLTCDYCFDELQVERLVAMVNSSNKQALSYNERLGYKKLSRFFTEVSEQTSSEEIKTSRQEWISFTLVRKDYIEATKQVRNLLSRNRSR